MAVRLDGREGGGMSREISRRAEKLARVISYSLDRSSLQDVLRSYGKAADEKLIDSALLHAFTLCRSRVVLHQRGIEREEDHAEHSGIDDDPFA